MRCVYCAGRIHRSTVVTEWDRNPLTGVSTPIDGYPVLSCDCDNPESIDPATEEGSRLMWVDEQWDWLDVDEVAHLEDAGSGRRAA